MKYNIYGIDHMGNKILIDVKENDEDAELVVFWHEDNYESCFIESPYENSF